MILFDFYFGKLLTGNFNLLIMFLYPGSFKKYFRYTVWSFKFLQARHLRGYIVQNLRVLVESAMDTCLY